MAIDSQLEKVVEDLKTKMATVSTGIAGTDLRPWLNYADIQKVAKFDFDGYVELFNRQQSNDNYATARQKTDAIAKDVAVPKLSGDLLAGFQRDHMMRTRSRIRMFAHVASRAKFNSTGEGPLRRNTIDFLNRIEAT